MILCVFLPFLIAIIARSLRVWDYAGRHLAFLIHGFGFRSVIDTLHSLLGIFFCLGFL